MEKLKEAKPVSAWRRRVIGVTRRQLAVELGRTAKLALPTVLAELGQVAMMITDLAFIGRISAEAVGAVALASKIYFVGLALGMGLMSAVAPLVAQAVGSDNPAAARSILRMGLWAALLLSPAMVAFMLGSEQILVALGQDREAARLAEQYLSGLAWGVLPALWFRAIRNFMVAVKRPEPTLWITLVAIPFNALLVYLLMYGDFGLPRLELLGVGVATTLVNCAMSLAALWFAIRRQPFRDYQIFAHPWHFDWPLMRQLIVVGGPNAMAFLMEYGLYSAAALLMGLIGTTALAAYQIASQIAIVLFKVPMGIAMAATVCVGHATGRKDASGARRAGLVAMLLGIIVTAVFTIAVIASRFRIVSLFLRETAENADATTDLAATLLLVSVVFFITETVETIAAGSLRGLKDTRVPLLCAGVSYWLIGFSMSYVLGLKIGLGAIGVWIGLSLGTTAYATLLVLRFQILVRRFALQSLHSTTTSIDSALERRAKTSKLGDTLSEAQSGSTNHQLTRGAG
ncbi:MATE family efflux transporter [Bradyrhizobium mercantei]|uniref:MATE family efflux transporter n=1 Tax=Bradyrhizobium mercantei TaxID=1904807 RepID=UPI0009754DC2|nr:MATE family efflux transporter [Bradyrhizobium mercantei]